MKIIYVIVFLQLLIGQSNDCFSQRSYLGNRKAVSIGVSTNYNVYNFLSDQANIIQNDSRLLWPKIELGYQWLNRRSAFKINGRYFALPSSHQFSSSSSLSPIIEEIAYDTVSMRSDVFGISVATRKFLNVAPVGWYFQFEVGINSIVNKSIHSVYSTQHLFQEETYIIEENHIVTRKIVTLGEGSLTIGKTFPLNGRVLLDIGIKGSLLLSDSRYDDQLIYDLKEHSIQKWVNIRSLLSFNLIGIYAGIQIFN
jgi:hypothetical protein